MPKSLSSMIALGLQRCPHTGSLFVSDENKFFKFCQNLFSNKLPASQPKLKRVLGERFSDVMRSSVSPEDFFSKSMRLLQYRKPVMEVHKVSFIRNKKKHNGMIAAHGISARSLTQSGFQEEAPYSPARSVLSLNSSTDVDVNSFKEHGKNAIQRAEPVMTDKLNLEVNHGIRLSNEQRKVLELALMGYNLFISGPAGTGKSILLREISRVMRGLGITVMLTAGRSLAAMSIEGVTVHSLFGAGLNKSRKEYKSRLKGLSVLIIDEVSLLKPDCLDSIHYVFQKAKHNYESVFGGVQIILAGDFLQCSTYQAGQLMYRTRRFLENFIHLRLSESHRVLASATQSKNFQRVLQEIRVGRIPWKLMKESVNFVESPSEVQPHQETMRLFFDSDEGCTYNQKQLEKLPGDAFQYPSNFLDLSLENRWTKTCITKLGTSGGDFRLSEIEINEIAQRMNSILEQRYDKYIPGLHGPLVVGFRVDEKYLRANVYDFKHNVVTIRPSDCYCGFRGQLIAECGIETHEVDDVIREVLKQREMQSYASLDSNIIPTAIREQVLERAAKKQLTDVELKVGASVMLTWNLNSCLKRGCIGTVIDFAPPNSRDSSVFAYTKLLQEKLQIKNVKYPKVRFTNGMTEVILPQRHVIGGNSACKFVRVFAMQLPVELCYGISYNKIQGLTVTDPLFIDFQHAQKPPLHAVYVALSRVRDPAQLTIANLKPHHVIISKSALDFEKNLLPLEKFRKIHTDTEEFQYAKSSHTIGRECHKQTPPHPSRKLVNEEERLKNLTQAFSDTSF